jgi:ATP-binding cassette subfamily B protein
MDLAFYDHPESYDLLYRAQVDAISQPLALLESLGSLVQNGLGFLVLAGILFAYAGWLPLLLVCTAIPGLVLVARQILKEHHWHLEHTNQAAARALPGLADHRSDRRSRIATLRSGKLPPEGLREPAGEPPGRAIAPGAAGSRNRTGAGVLAWAGSLAGLGWMLKRTLAGAVGLGDLLLCFQAFQQCQTLLRSLLEGAGKIYRSLLFVENLNDFLGLKPAILPGVAGESGLPVKESIRFEGVGFTYPGGFHRRWMDSRWRFPKARW